MRRYLCLWAIALSLVAVGQAQAREVGAIKKFVEPFPIATYELSGQISHDYYLSALTTPPPAQISVDGWWPDQKMLLISFPDKPLEGYFILYRAVEMNEPAKWEQRLSARGGPVCGDLRTSRRPDKTQAGMNGFINPC